MINQSYVTLIKKITKECKNYWPISLLQVDGKILPKMIANAKQAINKIIHYNETFSS